MKIHDDLGPEKLVEVYDQKTKMRGFLVVDNTWLGVAKGGLRITPSIDLEEIFHLARAMTYKNALADLPFGGGKSGILADPKILSDEQKKELVRAFSLAIKQFCPSIYMAGPDVNTGEREMEEFVKANGSLKSATGKPAEMCEKPGEGCGLPHELGSTGFGVVESIVEVLSFLGEDVKEKKVAVAGFGNVGTFVAKLLYEKGAAVVAISDSSGALYNEKGLDVDKVLEIKRKEKSVAGFTDARQMSPEEVFTLPVDILIPAALGGVITGENSGQIKAKVVVEAANLAVRADAEIQLFKRGVLVVPDILANAGGVISSYAEYRGFDEKKMFSLVESKIRENTKLVLQGSKKEKSTPRQTALKIAKERLEKGRRS